MITLILLVYVVSLGNVRGSQPSSPSTGDMSSTVLQVGETLWEESLLRGQSRTYLLAGFDPNSAYECVVSYSAQHPAVFELTVTSGGGAHHHSMSERHLLNTHKTIFTTKSEGSPEEQSVLVTATVVAYGTTALGSQPKEYIVPYSIRCDTLYVGLAPRVWKLILFALVCLAIGWRVLAPLLERVLTPPKEAYGFC